MSPRMAAKGLGLVHDQLRGHIQKECQGRKWQKGCNGTLKGPELDGCYHQATFSPRAEESPVDLGQKPWVGFSLWPLVIMRPSATPRAEMLAGLGGLSWASFPLTLNCILGRDSSTPTTSIIIREWFTDRWAQLSPVGTKLYMLHKLIC